MEQCTPIYLRGLTTILSAINNFQNSVEPSDHLTPITEDASLQVPADSQNNWFPTTMSMTDLFLIMSFVILIFHLFGRTTMYKSKVKGEKDVYRDDYRRRDSGSDSPAY